MSYSSPGAPKRTDLPAPKRDESWFEPAKITAVKQARGAVTEDRARLHTAVLVTPSQEWRKLRKQRRRAVARLHAEQRRSAMADVKAKAEEMRAERRATVYLPKTGEPGAARLRTPGRFHLTRHQDTSKSSLDR